MVEKKLEEQISSSIIGGLSGQKADEFLDKLFKSESESRLELLAFHPSDCNSYYITSINGSAVVVTQERMKKQITIYTVGPRTKAEQKIVLQLLGQKTGTDFNY